MAFEMRGLDALQRKMNDLSDRAKRLNGTHEVPIPELLTPEFLSTCSSFGSVQEMFEASGFAINSTDDFKAIPNLEWDAFVTRNTSFTSWKDMLDSAVRSWTSRQLGF